MSATRSRVVLIACAALLLAQTGDVVAFVGTYSTLLAPRISNAPAGDWDPADLCGDCNVVWISVDTLRADELGFLDPSLDPSPTPNVDEFAADSVAFTRAIAPAGSTLLSHGSMFTSLLPQRHGAEAMHRQKLSEGRLTLAEVLSARGYRTVAYTGGGQMNPIWGLGQGFDAWETEAPSGGRIVDMAGLVRSGRRFLREHDGGRFFLFLHTYQVHLPYTPRREDLELFDPDYSGDLPARIGLPLIRSIREGRREIGEADVRRIRAAYRAEIHAMDRQFGDLVRLLKGAGEYDRSLILFTTDHGEMMGERGEVARHVFLWDPILHIPLIVKFPGSRFAGSRIRRLVRGIDLFPTIAELVGVPPLPHLEGASMLPLLRDEVNGVVFAVSQRMRPNRNYVSAIQTRRFKLLHEGLYDLLADPGETRDVARRYPWVAESLARNLRRELERDAVGPIEEVEMDEELLEELRALGYVR